MSSQEPTFCPWKGWRPFMDTDPERYGLKGVEFDTPAAAARDHKRNVRMRVVDEMWIEVPLRPGWLAAYRLVPQAGEPVVAELRVFPNEGVPLLRRQPGRWSAELLGSAAEAPLGGLTTTVMRQVRVWHHRVELTKILRYFAEQFGEDIFDSGFLARRALAPPPRPGARRRWSDLDLARVADLYVNEQQSDRNVQLAARLKLSPKRVAALISRARARGLLFRGPQGKVGGGLTPEAKALLTQAARTREAARRKGRAKPKPARRTKRRGGT